MRKSFLGLLALSTLSAAGCGERDSRLDAPVDTSAPSFGLTGSAIVLDPALDRALVVTSPGPGELATQFLPIGHGVAQAQISPDKKGLFVLSRGEQPRRHNDDELPSLTVLEGDSEPKLVHRYELTDPLAKLGVDPAGQWLVAYSGDSVVTNLNELALIDLDDEARENWPLSKTIRSFGGSPRDLVFTSELAVPSGPARRFLVVLTDRDLALIDLLNLDRDEITVKMPDSAGGTPAVPVQVVYDDGEPDDLGDARIAVRLAGQSDVVLLELAPAAPGEEKDFTTTINIVDVGGAPDSIAFVHTDGGLRLAALVAAQQRAVLVDPATTVVEHVDLGNSFTDMTTVTPPVTEEGDEPTADVALLWSRTSSGVAFWSLGRTSSTPFHSVEKVDVPSVKDVIDVPGSKHGSLKILRTNENKFFVLDLEKRQGFPMSVQLNNVALNVSPDGERAWAFSPDTGQSEFSSIDLSDLHPTSLSIEPGVSAVYDIARADGGRSAIALHFQGALGATVLDAEAPDSAVTEFFPDLLLGGLQ